MSEREMMKNFLKKFEEEYGYSRSQIQTQFLVIVGRHKSYVDAVVFETEKRENPYILIEFKRKILLPLSTQQITMFLNLTSAKYAVLTDGRQKICFKKSKKGIITKIPDIPAKDGEEIKAFTKNQLVTPSNIEFELKNILNYLFLKTLSTASAKSELDKILLTKFVDEMNPDPVCQFSITPEEKLAVNEGSRLQVEFIKRIDSIFQKVKESYPEIFDEKEKIDLSPESLAYVVDQLQLYSIKSISEDVKGGLYEKIVSAEFRGAMGQFFTPREIVDFMVEMVSPTEKDRIIDPACGSGGFLIKCIQSVWNRIDELYSDFSLNERRNLKLRFAQNNVFGIDINPGMVKTAKMNILMHGDGHSKIFLADSLMDSTKIDQVLKIVKAKSGFDIAITNPPFGVKINDFNVLKNYKLGAEKKSQHIEVLFLERCIQFVKSKGKIAIVLPDGILINSAMKHVRDFILTNTKIKSVVSLPHIAFVPYGSGVKSSILLLEKKEIPGKDFYDYEIFMAIANNIGYDKTGRPTKNDLLMILEDYREFEKSLRLD